MLTAGLSQLAAPFGAAFVALLVVFFTHRFARDREHAQAMRALMADDRKVLREKLEQLVVDVMTVYEGERETALLPYRYSESRGTVEEMKGKPARPRSIGLMMTASHARQTLYFPSLESSFRNFAKTLTESTIAADDRNEAFFESPDAWVMTDDFWDHHVDDFKPAAGALSLFVNEARALLAKDFARSNRT